MSLNEIIWPDSQEESVEDLLKKLQEMSNTAKKRLYNRLDEIWGEL